MGENLHAARSRRRQLVHMIVTVLTVAFYLALIPTVVLLSGPIYRALECAVTVCEEPGYPVNFILPSRGALRVGSSIRYPNGVAVGRIVAFHSTGDERYIGVEGRLAPMMNNLVERPLRCEATANFNIEMDSDLVVSTCPGLDLPEPTMVDGVIICGGVDHFERMGQQLRRFVLDHIRPGEGSSEFRLTGPCGADNEQMTNRLRALVAGD